jgi:hypothetical protein
MYASSTSGLKLSYEQKSSLKGTILLVFFFSFLGLGEPVPIPVPTLDGRRENGALVE